MVAIFRSSIDYVIPPCFQLCKIPPAVALSAYHICLIASSSNCLISGVIAVTYIAIASGSPWVVPSWESKISSSMNSLMSFLYVFKRTLERGGQRWCMFWRAACRFNKLKGLATSTRIIASVSGDSNTQRVRALYDQIKECLCAVE